MRQSVLCLLAAIGISSVFGCNIAAGATTSPKNDSKDEILLNIPRIGFHKNQLWNLSDNTDLSGAFASFVLANLKYDQETIAPMDALDMVKECYAANFEKVEGEYEDSSVDVSEYYYKLPIADYYLVYEGVQEDNDYLIHLYEFVLDEPDTGIGHTVTYGWYTVDKFTGEVTKQMQ